MILLKACPKCGGDVWRESAPDDDLVCIQCGRRVAADTRAGRLYIGAGHSVTQPI